MKANYKFFLIINFFLVVSTFCEFWVILFLIAYVDQTLLGVVTKIGIVYRVQSSLFFDF